MSPGPPKLLLPLPRARNPIALARCASLLALAAAGIAAGCLYPTREHLFSGRAVTHVADTPGEEISVQGWVVSRPQGRSLSLTFSNQSGTAIPMSALVDEYTAKTVDGRSVVLKSADLFSYPDVLKPGDERTVAIVLPSGVPPEQIAQVVAKLNQGKAVAVLRAIGPMEPPAWRVGSASPVMINEPARAMRMEPAQSPMRPIPEILEPVGPVAPRSEAPVGTVPVTVEFEQPLGTALRADVFWNDRQDPVTLASGQRQLFYVKPGQHQVHVISRLPFLMETHARVPVVVDISAPVKVDISAKAKLSGVELRVRVWHGQKVSVDQTFSPLSGR